MAEFEQFARLLHADDSENRFMAVMVCAYCDESEQTRDPGVFTITATLGGADNWYDLGIRWRKCLDKHGLEKVGFHMSICENASEDPYKIPKDERCAMQRDFIKVINDTPALCSHVTAITAAAFPDLLAAIQPDAPSGIKVKAYYPAFQYSLKWMAGVLDERGFPPKERIAFVFDRQKEFQGNAKMLYDYVQNDARFPYGRRLGSLAFDSRLDRIQLQAADLIAYENMRYVREVVIRGDEKRRWQQELLASIRPARDMAFTILGV